MSGRYQAGVGAWSARAGRGYHGPMASSNRTCSGRAGLTVALLLLLLGPRAPARADAGADAAGADADAPAPWQVGVTAAQKEAAQRLLERGNELYVQNDFKAALLAYQDGLAQWAHPAIRFNLARTLIALDRPLEALPALEQAMAFGERPLADVWPEAVNYRTLLERQLGTIEVHCDQPGVEVRLDGVRLPSCPMTHRQRVIPGPHSVGARGPGLVPSTHSPVVVGGAVERLDLRLGAPVPRTRWAAWKPWAVAGASLLVAGLGGALELDAQATMDDYRRALRDECGERGCAGGAPSAAALALRDQAQLRDRVGVATMVVGGAGVVTGLVLVVMNRARVEVEADPRAGAARVEVTPLLGAGAIGLSVSGRH